MYCPNCGQQASANLRFCSRCGFPLGLISEVLAHGGFLPQLAALEGKKNLLTRRNGLIFSLFWFLIFVLILTPITAVIFDNSQIDGITPLFAIVGTMGSLVLMILSLFLPSSRKNQLNATPAAQNFAAPPQLAGNFSANALPPQSANFNPANAAYVPPAQQPQNAPLANWREANTNELVYPPSVTEDSTKLLPLEPNNQSPQ